jgi:PAS domain S-box-containing protein
LDRDGVVLEACGGSAELPLRPAELVGRSLVSAFPPDAAREVLEALSTLRGGAGAIAIQFALSPGAGASHVEVRLAADERGVLRAVVRDRGGERQALVELTAQRAFLRQVLDLDPNLIFAKDRDGRFTLANRAVASIYGVTPSELVGRTDADFNPDGGEIEHFRADDLEVMNSLRPMLIEKEPVTSPDGGTRWFQTIKIPIVSQDGHANAVLGVSADITSRKEAEDILERRSEQLLRHHTALRELALTGPTDLRASLERILRTASRTLAVERTGVWLFDADRTALRAECVFDRGVISDGPARVFPASDYPEYFRALHDERIVAAEDARTDPRTHALGAPYLEELAIASMLDAAILSHGTMIGVVCHEHRGANRAFTIEEQDFAASIADVVSLVLEESKRAALEEQLRHAQKMEAIGLLAGGISHDFNNLLNIISGYADLTAKTLPAGHPAAGHVEKITGACTRAADLIRKILTFSRGQVLRVEPLEFGGVLREFSTLLTRILGEDIELVVCASDEAMIVEADRTQLEQILLNLCTNARQAMPHGGKLTLDARPSQVEEEVPGRYVHLRVSDTGHGIDDATMSRLWEPFFTTKSEGTGLGLSMVYGIVHQHGGLIRAESRVGHGSTFHIFLPLHHEPVARRPAPVPAMDVRGYETILVAEDEALIRDLLRDSLGELGYTVLLAANGTDAVAVFERDPEAIDMVILDVVMPRLSGPEALARMAVLKPKIKALFISGHAPESARLSEQLQATGRAFLPKPFLLEALAAKVRDILNGDR